MIVPITHQSPEKRRENWDRAWKKYDNNNNNVCGIELTNNQAIIVVCVMFTLLAVAFYNLLTIDD